MSSVLVVGQDQTLLARHIAKKLNADIILCSTTQFADSETFLSLANPEKIAQARIVLVYQFFQSGSINDQLIGLFECVDQLKKLGSHSITALLPYLPYARQDQGVYKNCDGAAFMVGRCLRALGVQSIHACDVHAVSICPDYPLPLHNLSLENFWHTVILKKILQSYFAQVATKDRPLQDFCIVSPDEGGRERAEKIASLLVVSTAFVRKTRVAPDLAVSYELVGDVRGKRVILIDDIIDTGHTALGACDLLLAQGAVRVYGCFTHAVLAAGAQDRLAASRFAKIFVTDTVVGSEQGHGGTIEVVSINDHLAERLCDLMLQTSIF